MASPRNFSTESGRSATFKLASGQTVGYATYGAPAGPTIFYFHGLPSSRLEGALWSEAAAAAGARLVSLDRPGIGLSDIQPNRKLLDWPPIVVELAQHLQIEQFYVLGVSAGGPYAIACAKLLSDSRLQGVGVVAGMGPQSLGLDGMAFSNRVALKLTQWVPSLGVKLYDWMVIPTAQNSDTTVFTKQMTDGFATLSKKDCAVLENAKTKEMLVEAAREHFKQGNKGLPDEWRILVGDWGFELESVLYDEVRLWSGTEDDVCPLVMSQKMEQRLRHAELTELEGHTHYTIVVEKGEQILRELLSAG